MDKNKLYYKLTAHIPRPLPTTEEEFYTTLDLLVQYFGIDGDHQDVVSFASQIQATSFPRLRKSYAFMASAIKRVKINGTAQREKLIASNEIQSKLMQSVQSPSPEQPLPPLSEPQEGLESQA